METRKTYSAEFKHQAIQLATQPSHTVEEIARDLGIGRSTLSKWIRMARKHGELDFPGKGKTRLTPKQEAKRRVARLMRSAGLRGKGSRKYKKTTNAKHALPVSQHLVNREFKVEQPNRPWGADLTYIPTREGWLYLAVVLDLHSCMVVGWAVGNRTTTDLPLAALNMAVHRRSPRSGLIHHSDRGSAQASSWASVLPKKSIRQSDLPTPFMVVGHAGQHAQ